MYSVSMKTTENEIKLQYRLSNGAWRDCGERTNEFLDRCVQQSGLSESAVISQLESGQKIRNAASDWYSYCRDGEYAEKIERKVQRASVEQQKKLIKTCSECGETGSAGSYPFSTIADGNICDNCL